LFGLLPGYVLLLEEARRVYSDDYVAPTDQEWWFSSGGSAVAVKQWWLSRDGFLACNQPRLQGIECIVIQHIFSTVALREIDVPALDGAL
jgi:hypothetical protein